MEERLRKIIYGIQSWADLNQLEANINEKGGMNAEIAAALKARSTAMGIAYIEKETGLVLAELTDAERAIVLAIGEYAAILKRQGKTPTRTLPQIRSRGLIDAAEASVCNRVPTHGFQVLAQANLEDLSYESIIIAHPSEFSPRAIWFARRTLGLENVNAKAPAATYSDVNTSTTKLLTWLRERAAPLKGKIAPFSNAEAAAAIGLGALKDFGRVHGNIQSRIDFACYLCDLPPLGCAAQVPFNKAWDTEGRSWAFQLRELQLAAQGRSWASDDFLRIQETAENLPGISHLPWKDEFRNHEQRIRAWSNRWAKVGALLDTKSDGALSQHRLAADILSQATPDFIWSAVQLFMAGSVDHAFAPSTDFDLIVDKFRFPPKAVFGVALSLALGGRLIEPKHFSGGEGSTCFRLLREAGYSVLPKGQDFEDADASNGFDQEWLEGGIKLVQHLRRERSAGLSNAKKAQHRRLHGALTCEHCGDDPVKKYGTVHAESCIEVHHSRVLVRDMAPAHISTLDDLQCLCANCHRLEHRRMATA